MKEAMLLDQNWTKLRIKKHLVHLSILNNFSSLLCVAELHMHCLREFKPILDLRKTLKSFHRPCA